MPKNINSKLVGNNEIVRIAEADLREKIHIIRGKQVILDYDLAKYYGYTTKAFNQQVQRNIERFEGEDFMFRLAKEEIEKSIFVRSQFVTSRSSNLFSGQNGGTRYLPYAFTEQGIYMLMTVLKGELAIKQSRALIMLFKTMKDYIVETNNTLAYKDNLQLALQVAENSQNIGTIKSENWIIKSENKELRSEVKRIDEEIKTITREINDTVKKSDISPVFLDFNRSVETREYLILNGEPIKAKDAYMEIYKHAKKRIYIVDNYIDIKTLHLLQIVKRNLEIVFFTDNTNHYLRKSDIIDFEVERPDLKLTFIKTNQTIHDRFIVLDEDKVYQSGGSSKDAGKKMTTILEIDSSDIKQALLNIIEKLRQNPKLELR